MSRFIYIVLVFAFALSVNIAEMVFSQRYMDDSTNTCHNDHLVKPAVWLQWDSIIGFVEAFVVFITLMCGLCEFEVGYALGIWSLAPIMTAQFIWVIMGGVSLWRDNDDCGPKPLHDMMWAAVLIHIILIGIK